MRLEGRWIVGECSRPAPVRRPKASSFGEILLAPGMQQAFSTSACLPLPRAGNEQLDLRLIRECMTSRRIVAL